MEYKSNSPLTNHRKDEYTGETLEGRLRFHVEVVRQTNQADMAAIGRPVYKDADYARNMMNFKRDS